MSDVSSRQMFFYGNKPNGFNDPPRKCDMAQTQIWKIMDGVLLRTVFSTYTHKDHVFRDIEKDLRKMAKGILAYAVEAIAYCCGCAADSCGLSPGRRRDGE